MMRVLSVSTGRSDHGLLSPVWDAIAAHPALELKILLTGMQVRDDVGARAEMPVGTEALTVGEDLGGGAAPAVNRAAAQIMAAAGDAFTRLSPDLVLVIGDRLDMLPVAAATLPFNLPLAHLHGGEQTFGAVDDRIRHATTKLAHVHFPATTDAATRLIQMGEEAWRITVTGAPGLDALRQVRAMTASELSETLGLPSIDSLILVTVHPETNSSRPSDVVAPVLSALKGVSAPLLFTAPNSDPGADAIKEAILAFVGNRPNAIFRDTLGGRLYANAMRHAAMMVGNSSSGLIEAPIFNLPVVNVGSRQAGRLRGANVIDVAAQSADISVAIRQVQQKARSSALGVSPYGDGHAAPRIAMALAALPDRRKLMDKRFGNGAATFTAPWAA